MSSKKNSFIFCIKCEIIKFFQYLEESEIVKASCIKCNNTIYIPLQDFNKEVAKELEKIILSSQKCGFCKKDFEIKDKQKIYYCQDCDLIFCGTCQSAHFFNTRFNKENHTIEKREIYIAICPICKVHENVKYFCKQCNCHLCNKCKEKHSKKNHEIIDLFKEIKNPLYLNALNVLSQIKIRFQNPLYSECFLDEKEIIKVRNLADYLDYILRIYNFSNVIIKENIYFLNFSAIKSLQESKNAVINKLMNSFNILITTDKKEKVTKIIEEKLEKYSKLAANSGIIKDMKIKVTKEKDKIKNVLIIENKESDKVSIGKFISNEGIYYEGEFKNYKFDGFGTLYKLISGDIYKGNFIDGELKGIGCRYLKNGIIYSGNFNNNAANGFGSIMQYQANFKGIFENNIFKFGSLERYNATENYYNSYEGYINNHQKNGFGKLINIGKENYTGFFQKGKFNGLGEIKYGNGNIYFGTFQNNLKHGKGFYYDAYSKQLYKGEWFKDKKNGYGELYYNKKGIFEGENKNNIFEGCAIKYSEDDKIEKGTWINDKKEGLFIVIENKKESWIFYNNDNAENF